MSDYSNFNQQPDQSGYSMPPYQNSYPYNGPEDFSKKPKKKRSGGIIALALCCGADRLLSGAQPVADARPMPPAVMAYAAPSVQAPQAILERYGVTAPEESDFPGYDMLTQAGRRRGFLLRGGEIDTERMARILLDEFRGGVLGRITLETPEDYAE